MQTVLNPEYKTGIFKRELKNRFLCEVEIDGESTVCYVPSSCHLGNFLQLEGKKVLLIPTRTKNARTPYALLAIPYKQSYILLNTSNANRAVENSIHSRRFSSLGKRKTVFKEHYVGGYKCDLFIEDTSTIIEVKSVLSTGKNALFPTIFSERSLKQLEKLKHLLVTGYTIRYMIVALNPYTNNVSIAQNTAFFTALTDCLKHGMTLSAFTCRIKGDRITIDREIPICLEDYDEQ